MVIPAMNMRSTRMTLKRVVDGQVTEQPIDGIDLSKDGLTFSVDADVLVGDIVSYKLPSGRVKSMRITEVHVLQSPFQGGPNLDHTKAEYVEGDLPPLNPPKRIDLPGLHPAVSAASGSKFAQRQYGNAVFDAFKAVEHRVQTLTGESASGKPLMSSVFSEKGPTLDITTSDAGDRQRQDQIEGYKFLFMGATLGLRNPQGHGGEITFDEQEALEALALASLLMRSLDRAESRLTM
ncbi:TIGR02391 family protein [Rhodococcus sp. NPDC003318]|uniref:TIGR02391 family protein n=1 Tax=Rhodococcus sp. NPDC003318 TaxID=3364503 RepID=UPI0036815642